MKLDHSHMSRTKINSALIKDIKIRPETIKFLEESVDSTLMTLVLSRCFGYVSSGKGNKNKN